MLPAFLKDDAWLAEVRAASRSDKVLHTWWLGQSGFLLQWNGIHLLFDPYLSDSLTRKYATTDKPHTRMTERVIAPERLDFIDVVTSSHNHTDHLDAETLQPLLRGNAGLALVIPEANREFVAGRVGIEPARPIGLNDGDRRTVAGLEFQGVASAHDVLETDAAGQHKYLGYIVRLGPFVVYHSGDTRWYDGLVDRLRPQAVNLGFLPINGFAPERRVAGNLNIAEAVELGVQARMQCVVPHHFHMFTFNTADPAEFARAAATRGLKNQVLRAGERLTLSQPGREVA